MQMVRFSGKTDQGYVAVSDQIWAWVENIESQPPPASAPSGSNQGDRQRRAIESGGGPIFMGTTTVGRDLRINNQTHQFYR